MNLLMNMLVFVLNFLEYWTMYYLCFSKQFNRYWYVLGIGGCLAFLIAWNPNIAAAEKYLLIYICVLGTVFLMMQGTWKQRLVTLLELFFLICSIGEISSMFVKMLVLHLLTAYELDTVYSVLANLLSLLILGVLAWVKVKRRKLSDKIWSGLTEKLHYFVIMMAIEIQIIIASLNYAEKFVPNPRFSSFVVYLCVLSYASVGILGIFVIYIRRTNRKIEGMLQSEMQRKDMQKYYYEALLEKEEDTRRYRHDMANHLLCLNQLMTCQDVAGATEYLQRMQNQIIQIQRKGYVTGNQTLDVITNYHLARLEPGTDIQVSGQVEEALWIDNTSLCTIYANLLQNAVEELTKEGENKFIRITFLQGREYLQITIQNSLSKDSIGKKELLRSEKADRKNHGIGLKNVREAVEACNGKLNLNPDKEGFTAQVLLPNMTVQQVK